MGPGLHVCCAFGPNGALLLEVEGKRYRRKLPEELEKLYRYAESQRALVIGDGLKRTVALAIFRDGGYVVAYENYDGKFTLEDVNIPDTLRKFLDHKHAFLGVPDLETLFLSVGANPRTFFATVECPKAARPHVHRYRWSNLPSSADAALQYNTACSYHAMYTWHLSIGANKSYIAYTKEGPSDLWFAENIPDELRTAVKGVRGHRGFWDPLVVLNPYDEKQYFYWFPADLAVGWVVDDAANKAVEAFVLDNLAPEDEEAEITDDEEIGKGMIGDPKEQRRESEDEDEEEESGEESKREGEAAPVPEQVKKQRGPNHAVEKPVPHQATQTKRPVAKKATRTNKPLPSQTSQTEHLPNHPGEGPVGDRRVQVPSHLLAQSVPDPVNGQDLPNQLLGQLLPHQPTRTEQPLPYQTTLRDHFPYQPRSGPTPYQAGTHLPPAPSPQHVSYQVAERMAPRHVLEQPVPPPAVKQPVPNQVDGQRVLSQVLERSVPSVAPNPTGYHPGPYHEQPVLSLAMKQPRPNQIHVPPPAERPVQDRAGDKAAPYALHQAQSVPNEVLEYSAPHQATQAEQPRHSQTGPTQQPPHHPRRRPAPYHIGDRPVHRTSPAWAQTVPNQAEGQTVPRQVLEQPLPSVAPDSSGHHPAPYHAGHPPVNAPSHAHWAQPVETQMERQKLTYHVSEQPLPPPAAERSVSDRPRERPAPSHADWALPEMRTVPSQVLEQLVLHNPWEQPANMPYQAAQYLAGAQRPLTANERGALGNILNSASNPVR